MNNARRRKYRHPGVRHSFVVLLLLSTTSAQASYRRIESSAWNEGSTFVSEIRDADVRGTPSWTADMPSPPLVVRKAMSIATTFLSQQVTNHTDWAFESISLHEFRKNKWYYIADFVLRRDRITNLPAPLARIVVLMDGSVVTRKEKQERQADDPSKTREHPRRKIIGAEQRKKPG